MELDYLESREETFQRLRSLAHDLQFGDEQTELIAQEETIRLLEHREELGSLGPILDDLVGLAGLFPYEQPESLDTRALLRREVFRLNSEIVLHREQARALTELMGGKNLVLSAPTSFGKSLLIDAILLLGEHDNIVIVVPTLALIDETRRRLSRLGSGHKIISLPTQAPAARNVWVLTQERVLELPEPLPRLDIFIIDEFYKLRDDAEERGRLLNIAFSRLLSTGAQFYLLGPNVSAFAPSQSRLEYTFMHSPYSTVATDVQHVSWEQDAQLERLVDLVGELDGQTLVYVSSPRQAGLVAQALVDAVDEQPVMTEAAISAAADWAEAQFHPEWSVARSLRRGIGVHHGKLPRSLSQFIIEAFNLGWLKTLVCTSTLIEGVNTTAQNVIIYDKKVGRRNFDYFTYNNIRGRSGRMLQHFVGRVYLFHEAPTDDLISVDIPIISLPDDAHDATLIQVPEDVLDDASRERRAEILQESGVPLSLLQALPGIEPSVIAAVRDAVEYALDDDETELVMWSGFPSTAQLRWFAEQAFGTGLLSSHSTIRSAAQLRFLLGNLGALGLEQFIRAQIANQLERGDSVDEAVQRVLEILRVGVSHHVPRALSALDTVQRHVLTDRRMSPGNYNAYAVAVANLFLRPPATVLEEYGIPLLAADELLRLAGVGASTMPKGERTGDNLDYVLERLATIDLDQSQLHPHERLLAGWALADIQPSLLIDPGFRA